MYFPIKTSGSAKKKMENSKSYYFRILLELAFLKGAKMAAELCKSRSYSIVFQKMTQIWNSCASLGMDLSVEHKASTWHLVYQQLSKAQVDNCFYKKNSVSLWYQFILPHNFTSIFSNLYNSTYHVHGVKWNVLILKNFKI